MSKKADPRLSVTKALQTKFSKSKSQEYEKKIHQMCVQLAEEVFEETVEEIYKYYAYEKTGQLIESSTDDLQHVLKDIETLRIGEESFYHRKFDIKKPKREGPLIGTGVFPCFAPGCRARYTKETTFTMQQRRSGDEGMTCVVTCIVCGKLYTL